MSSCISGGRTYGFDLEIIKSPSTSSNSSTLSESSNSPLAISTRKPRTPRKRPNQTYNEAAVLLSTAYPNIFSTKHITNPRKFTKPFDYFSDDSLMLLHPSIQEKPSFRIDTKVSKFSEKQIQSLPYSMELSNEYQTDFDTESMLDEEIDEGIDSIMGNSGNDTLMVTESLNPVYRYPYSIGLGFGGKFEFGFGFGIRRGVRALRNVDDGNWWNFPTVDVLEISPKLSRVSVPAPAPAPAPVTIRSEKKKKKVDKPAVAMESEKLELGNENSIVKMDCSGLKLKLNYDAILNAWSDKESPISYEALPGSETAAGNDIYARLAQIDLFSENGGVREASVLRYKEKRRTRLFSKKIRYQVRKINADQRPRMKGRFVRRPNSSNSSQR